MLINLKCEQCTYSYKITEAELQENGHYHKSCLICGGKIKVDNLDEIINWDIENKVEDYLKLWFNKFGIEGTIQIIEQTQDTRIKEIYLAKLKEKKLIK